MLLLLCCVVATSALPSIVHVDANHAVGTINDIRGVSRGVIWDSEFLNHTADRDDRSKNFTFGYGSSRTAYGRTHGTGCVDMDLLWRPFPSYDGQDATDPSNYDWASVDACMLGFYNNSALPAKVSAFVRLGHSRAWLAEYPAFSLPPDNFAVWAQVCLQIIRHLNDGWDHGFHFAVRDFSIWNEPAVSPRISPTSPFWRGTAAQYACLYSASYSTIKTAFADEVRVGPCLGLGQFDRDVLGNLTGNCASKIDFVDMHLYKRRPWDFGTCIPLAEQQLVSAGFSATTPLLIGEWSRQIPLYAQDIPGAAFVASALTTFNAVHPSNSNHAVERVFLFAAPFLWSGLPPYAAGDAGVVWNVWEYMSRVTPVMVYSNFSDSQPPADCCRFSVLAGKSGKPNGASTTTEEVTLLVTYYNTTDGSHKAPEQGHARWPVVLRAQLPWNGGAFSWEHKTQDKGASLRVVDTGEGTGNLAAIATTLKTNTYSVIRISKQN
jgi:hypothetical protein